MKPDQRLSSEKSKSQKYMFLLSWEIKTCLYKEVNCGAGIVI